MGTMTLAREGKATGIARRKSVTRTYLGSYMPFAGVRYYGTFTNRDIAKGHTKIGPVGWRTNEANPDDEPSDALLAA